MKYLSILFIALFCCSVNVQAQSDAISKYFDEYMEDERFTVVYISSKLFEMVTKFDFSGLDEDMNDPEVKMAMEVLKDLKGLRVLTTDINPMAAYQDAIKRLNTKEYEMLLTVRDKDENVRFWIKDQGKIINELLLLVGGQEEFVLLSLVGNIDLDKISSLAKTMDVNGMEHLDKIKGNKN